MRAFIAIEIPNEIKKAIAVQTAELQTQCGRAVRWVTPDNMHLTLKFLGELKETKVGLVSQVISQTCPLFAPFDILVSGSGCFPTVQRPSVIWAGLKNPAELLNLQRKMESELARQGFPAEERPFSAHLTIGRVRSQVGTDEMKELQVVLKAMQIAEIGKFSASAVTLFKSELQPAGAIYTSLFKTQLGQ